MKRSGPLPHSTVRLAVLLAVIALALILATATAALAQEPPPNPSPPAAPRAAANPGGACGDNPAPPAAIDPAIRLTGPAPFTLSGSPLRFTGGARVFEGTVRYTLRDAAGTVLADGFTTAEAGAPAFAPFAAAVRVAVPRETPVCLRVFEENAEDGRPRNIVQLPLTLRPFDPARDAGADTGAGLKAAAGLGGPLAIGAVVGDWAVVRSADTAVLLQRSEQGRWAPVPTDGGPCALPETPPLLCTLPTTLPDTSGLPPISGRPEALGPLRFLAPEQATAGPGSARPDDLAIELELPEPRRGYRLSLSQQHAAYGPLEEWVYDRVMDGARLGCPLTISRLEVNGGAVMQVDCRFISAISRTLYAAPAGLPGPVAVLRTTVEQPAFAPWQPLADQAIALLLGSLRVAGPGE